MGDPIGAITRQNLGVYRESPARLQEDVSQEAQVAHDYRGRLAYELLQNADDAMESSDGRDDRILFHVTDDALWVANTGRPFTARDVEGLCGLGASSKVDAGGTRRASIGHKGLGFKSVLEITEAPLALSTSWSFALGEEHARAAVEPLYEELARPAPQQLPAMRFPAPVTPPARWHELQAEGYNAAFVFPFADRVDDATRRRLADLLLDLPVTTIVFLKHLEEVTVRVDQSARRESATWRASRARLEGDAWVPAAGLTGSGLYRVTVNAEGRAPTRFLLAHDEDVRIGANRDGLSGPSWMGVDLTEVSVAVLDPEHTADPLPGAWRHFHVFLPTEEPNPYPFLVNGAFTTDLSRQQVKVGNSVRDYNLHLVQSAAGLFRRELAPRLAAVSPQALLAALDMAEEPAEAGAAARLHAELTAALADLEFLPSHNAKLALPHVLVPPIEAGEQGPDLADLVRPHAAVDGARLPDPELCLGQPATVAAMHGARRLTALEALEFLTVEVDPDRDRLVKHPSGRFMLDPVVEFASVLWSNAEPDIRDQLEERAKQLPLFPTQVAQDGSVGRVALRESEAFYPPQSARQDLPLSRLAFMLHDVCWGDLQANERKRMLDDRMIVWRALFDVSEFRFEEVMRAAVLPALALVRDDDAETMHHSLQSMDALAAICQLAGNQTKPDRPLRYQRLQSDRALFNLSRLPVPCVVDGPVVWEPAFKAYFGRDWFPDDSVDEVIDALEEPGRLQLPRLAPPDRFLGLLAQYQDVAEDAAPHDGDEDDGVDDDDEVSLDEDFDQPLEATERDRWVDFLSWIGVNRCLRPVHFHDVMDEHRWLSTPDLKQPKGWAFADLGADWDTYAAYVRSLLDGHPAAEQAVPYLYECHDLEGLGEVIAQAQRDPGASVARALWRHLAQHWETYQRFTTLELAMVGEGKSPGQRAKPPRAMAEERLDLGDNLWVHRMRGAGICPTSHGPRRPEVAWVPSREVERRFTRQRGRPAGAILPVLDIGEGLPRRSVRSLAERLGVRLDLNPTTFTVEDAAGVCQRLAHLFGDGGDPVEPDSLSRTIRPTYRQVFALLSGAAAPTEPLTSVPMLAERADGFHFLPAAEVLYARNPGTRERSGVADKVATFVIEADPTANRPVTTIFGMRTLEDALDWEPDPGDAALDEDELSTFRSSLRALAPWLLARLRADRADAASEDRDALLEFVDRVEPVTDLQLACSRDGQLVTPAQPRSYYVANPQKGEPQQGFLVWDGAPWPPNPEARKALAMAMADALGVNHVETFLAFIDTDEPGRRQLLDLAGAASFYDEILEELNGPREVPVVEDDEREDATDAVMTPAPEADTHGTATTGVTPPAQTAGPAAAKVPLISLDDFELSGEIERVAGEPTSPATPSRAGGPDATSTGASDGHGSGGTATSRAAPGMDLSELDRIGMLITMDYELGRLRAAGLSPQVVPSDGEPGDTLVVDVSTPAAVQRAKESSAVCRTVLEELRQQGVSEIHPGFDILTIASGRLDRAIELKSSGVDARVQATSWNEWKSASQSGLRAAFWLYLVNNLRADLPADPYVRAIHDPFGTLIGKQTSDATVRRAVQLRVQEFEEAEQMTLRPRRLGRA